MRFVQEKGLGWGAYVPDCHDSGEFSCSSPSNELHPGPPFSQMVISFDAAGLELGKNQKNNWFLLVGVPLIERVPAKDSPMSKSTSGRAVKLTRKAAEVERKC